VSTLENILNMTKMQDVLQVRRYKPCYCNTKYKVYVWNTAAVSWFCTIH